MDKTAVQEIARMSAAAIAGAGPLNDHAAIVVPDGYKLQSLEHLQAMPDHFKACFSTTVLSEFIAYINHHGDEKTGCFIDHKAMKAMAIIDLGNAANPLWGKHRAEIELVKTPAFCNLLNFAYTDLLQQNFIDFADDWRDNINFYFGDESYADKVPFAMHLRNIRNIKVNATQSNEQTVGNFNASHSALESIEIKSGTDQLPTGFTFTTVPYEGFEPVIFDCQLRAIHDDKTVKLKFRIIQRELMAENIANEFRDKLIKGIKPELNAAIFLGKIAYQ